MNTIARSVPLLCLLLTLASCSTGSRDSVAERAEPAAVAAPFTGAAPLTGLPPFPAGEPATQLPPRSVSASPQESIRHGEDWESASGAVAVDGTRARLFKLDPHTSAWAIYRLPTLGLRLGNAEFQLTAADDYVWLLRANYATGRWDAQGPYGNVSPFNLNFDQPEYYNAAGAQYFALLAYNADPAPIFEQVRYEVLVPLTERHDLATTGSGTAVALVEKPVGPALIFYDGDTQLMRYARAEVAEPVDATDWTITNMDLFPRPAPLSLSALYNGTHVIAAYFSQATNSVVIAREPNEGGIAAWSRKTIPDGGPCDLAIIDGRLTLAFHQEDLFDDDGDGLLGRIIVGYPTDGDSLGDWTLHKAGGAELTPMRPRVASVAGKPALAWKMDNAGALRYAYSTAARPESGVNWNYHQLNIPVVTDTLNLFEHRGVPYMYFGWGSDVWELYGLTVTPDTVIHWTGDIRINGTLQHDEFSLGSNVAITTVLNLGDDILAFIRVDEPATAFMAVNASPDGFLALSSTSIGGVPAVAYVRGGPAGGTVAYARSLAE